MSEESQALQSEAAQPEAAQSVGAHRHSDVAWFVYDMDGVITTHNCLIGYLRTRLLAAPLHALRAFPDRVRLTFARDEDTRMQVAMAMAESVLHGMSMRRYRRSARRYGTWSAHRPGFVRKDIVSSIRAQHAQGARVVVATACERTLAEAVLRAAGVQYDLLSASEFTEGPHGIVVEDMRVGARKHEALRELGVPLESAHFYTDAYSDHPTARRSRRVTLVGAGRLTARRFRNAGIGVRLHRDRS